MAQGASTPNTKIVTSDRKTVTGEVKGRKVPVDVADSFLLEEIGELKALLTEIRDALLSLGED